MADEKSFDITVPPSGPAKVRAVLENAREVKRTAPSKAGSDRLAPKTGKIKATNRTGGRRRGPPTRDTLLSIVEDDGTELWRTPGGEAFATVRINSHLEHWPIRSLRFRHVLIGRYHEGQGGAPGAQGVEDALRVLEAKSVTRGRTYRIYSRIAGQDDRIFLDLVNDDWEAVEITSGCWRVVPEAPVKFVRSQQMRPLPRPETGGSLDDLTDLLNLPSDESLRLVIVWTLACFLPAGPYPLLLVNGEAGAAKTTLSRVLRGHVDPNAAPVRSAPRDERDLYVSASNAWLLAFDNLSGVPNWLSDAFCRLSTGGGFGTRRLHSDRDEVVFDSERPVLLNGIPDLAARPDLADRGIYLMLPAIPKNQRRTEKEYWETFERSRPFALGALLGALVGALAHLQTVQLETLPRMADFAIFGVAVERALGWPEGSFLQAYESNRADAVMANIEASPVAEAIIDLMKRVGESWEGTMTELMAELENEVDDKVMRSKAWPASVSALGIQLRRIATALRARGVDVTMRRVGGADRKRMVFIRSRAMGS